MKKEILAHSLALIILFALIALFRNYFQPRYILFLVGGIIGTLLPDVDHLIYVYAFSPQDLTSQRVNLKLQNRDVKGTLALLYSTRSERKKLVFHTAFFQIIFLLLAFLVISSSGNVFGTGLVLAFALHLSVDQIIDLDSTDTLNNWFSQPPLNISLDKEKSLFYWLGILVLILIFGFLL